MARCCGRDRYARFPERQRTREREISRTPGAIVANDDRSFVERSWTRNELPELIERKPGLGNERGAAPVGDQSIRVGDEIDAAARSRIWIPRKHEAVFL